MGGIELRCGDCVVKVLSSNVIENLIKSVYLRIDSINTEFGVPVDLPQKIQQGWVIGLLEAVRSGSVPSRTKAVG